MKNKERYFIFNKFYSDKVFSYNDILVNGLDYKIKFDYKIKITGSKSFIVVGEPVEHVLVDLEISNVRPDAVKFIFENINDGRTLQGGYYGLWLSLIKEIENILSYFSINEQPWIDKMHMKEEKTLTEGVNPRSTVRTIVNDIVKIFKEEGVGNFELPEDLTGEMTYSFQGIDSELTVEVNIIKTKEVDGLEVDGGYYKDEDVLEIEIVYNPSYGTEIMYDLVGKLNEIVRHELQHVIQYEKGTDLDSDESDPLKYYLQPHEVDAQIAGLKRLSKLRREPFEKTVRDWFDDNQSKHNLSQEQKEKVIQFLLNKRK